MKSNLIGSLTVCMFLLLLFSCKHSEKGTLDYKTLNYDTNSISIFKWDKSKYIFPDYSEQLPLAQDDLFVIDSLLKNAIDSFNNTISQGLYEQVFNSKVPLDSFVIKPIKYKYQFFPYKDSNGQRIVNIIGFSRAFQSWKTEIYHGGRHYGISKIELKVNLSDKTRDNIRSGDYG